MKQIEKTEFIIDDKEFSELFPRQTNEEYKTLEQSIIHDGCRDKLTVGIIQEGENEKHYLLDGYTRLDICTKNNIEYEIHHQRFTSRAKAKAWMINYQFGRRNMSIFQRAIIAMKFKDEITALAKENKKKGVCLNSDEGIDTLKQLAKIAGVGRDTMNRVRYILDHATEEEQEELRNGDIKINKVYQKYINKEKQTKQKPIGRTKMKHSGNDAKDILQVNNTLENVAELVDNLITDNTPPEPANDSPIEVDDDIVATNVAGYDVLNDRIEKEVIVHLRAFEKTLVSDDERMNFYDLLCSWAFGKNRLDLEVWKDGGLELNEG